MLILLGQRGHSSPRTRHHSAMEGAPTQRPHRKQHIARLSPSASDHPLCTTRQQPTPHNLEERPSIHGSSSLQLQPPQLHQLECIFKRDRLSAAKIDRRQHHTICSFYPALIPLVTGLLIHVAARPVQLSHIDTFMRPNLPRHTSCLYVD